MTEQKGQSGQSNISPAYSYGSWNSSGSHRPYSPGDFATRNNNSGPAFQTDSSALRPSPTVNVTAKRESDTGKLADAAAALTPLGYPLDLYSAIYGETFFGREPLGAWERLLVAIPLAGPIRRVGGAALDVANRTVSKIDDVTKPGSRLPNIKTDVPKSEFEKNLLNKGFTKTISGDGKTNIYTNENKKYTTRDFSKSTGGPTADVYMNGKPISKIRLGDE